MRSLLLFIAQLLAVSEAMIMPWPMPSNEPGEPVKYVVTFPTFIRTTSSYKFNLILFENENYTLPVSFVAKLSSGYDRDSQVLAQQTFTQTSYGLQQHAFDNLKSVSGLSEDSGLKISIEFSSFGMKNHSEISTYGNLLNEKYVFVQTDKAMYKPTQTVYFRCVALNRQLMPLNGSVNVIVEDSKNNQIKQWTDQRLDRGVFGASLVLSDYVNFGDWKIKFSGSGIPETEKTFTVQQYVLPKYEVKLDFTPTNYWLYGKDDNQYQGFIRAKYTFGKSVRGKAVIRLTNSGGCNYRYDYPNGYFDGSSKPPVSPLQLSVTLAGDGSADDGKFTLTGLNNIVNSQDTMRFSPDSTSAVGMMSQSCTMNLQVNVTEELTGEVISSEGTVTLYRDPFLIKVHDSVQKTLKPGLPFTMRMQVTKPDDTPVGADVAVLLETYYWLSSDPARYSVSCYQPYYSSPISSTQPVRAADLTSSLTTDSNGLISIEAKPPKNVESVLFKATLVQNNRIQLCDTRNPPRSMSNQTVSISIDRPISSTSTIPKVGDKLVFKIQASYATSYVYFLMSQNGEPFVYRKIETPTSKTTDSTLYVIETVLPPEAAPRCAAAVWTVENTVHEVLADAIEFQVDGLVKQNVSASFSPSTVRPGAQTQLTVKTSEPNALVALLAVDKSVKLLKSGNDIMLDDVLNTVGGGSSGSVSPVLFRCWRCGWFPWWIDSSNAESVFSGISMAIKSNARTRSNDMIYPMYMEDGIMPMAMAGNAFRGPGGPQVLAMVPPSAGNAAEASKATAPAFTVRKEFPELWIWREGSIDSTGTLNVPLTAPDTITTWVLSAFAVGSNTGFGALNSPAELTVFQPFFVTLDVPYATVIRNEQFEIKAVVFNYQATSQSVNLVLAKSEDFEVSGDSGATYSSVEWNRVVSVPANDGSSVSIWIKPKRLGDITMLLSGTSSTDSSSRDAMEKVVTVEAEGDIRYSNRPVFVRFDQQTTQTYTINTNEMFGGLEESKVVSGSKMFQLQAIGDLLGPALTSLGNNIRLPTGCGEQTMVILAPNVYIYKYLKSVKSLTEELEAKTVRFVDQGYQRELTYQRSDGGYSAFGASDEASSTWLTAFVMRCFKAATKHVNTQIDSAIFEKSWGYLRSRAKSDGTFDEPGKVLHHSMKGGATSADNLAAYIYIAYAEAGGVYSWSSLAATRSRLEKLATNPAASDPYQLALVAYAFSILPQDTQISKQILTKLMSMSTRDSDLMYWKPENDQSTVNEYSRSGPSRTETSAYVLLTLCNHNQMENATSVARWLMSQRNSLGGFESTQDTVVGLQALAEFASKLSTNGVTLRISATFNFGDGGQPLYNQFDISQSNSKLLFSYDVPRNRQSLTSVSLSVTGVGVGLIQLALKYNVQAQKVMDSGDYSIIISETIARKKREAVSATSASNDVSLQSCLKPITPEAGVGMVVYELGIPTGFTADLEATKSANNLVDESSPSFVPGLTSGGNAVPLKRIEVGNRKLVFYFDALDRPTCVVGRMSRTSLVKNAQPPVARVYNYYDTVRVNSTLFQFSGMSADDQSALSLGVACPPGTVCYSGASSHRFAFSDVMISLMSLILLLVVF